MAKNQSPTPDELDESRQIALDKALGDITKRYGDGTIMRRYEEGIQGKGAGRRCQPWAGRT